MNFREEIMKTIKVKTPAKINLTLEILAKRPDGFHNIQSVMQTVNLYDYLTVSLSSNNKQENIIELSGNNPHIPYDSSNLIYKAAVLYLDKANIKGVDININIEKHIPVAAGLAGGSSNAAGILFALNYLYDNLLDMDEIDNLAAKLGSDVNFCLYGGTQIATSRGEILKKAPTPNLNVAILKPKNLGISAKEAYTRYAELENKPVIRNTEEIVCTSGENNVHKIAELLNNDLEKAILPHYEQIQNAKQLLKQAGALNTLMSGSGPSVFGIFETEPEIKNIPEDYEYFNVKSTTRGVEIV